MNVRNCERRNFRKIEINFVHFLSSFKSGIITENSIVSLLPFQIIISSGRNRIIENAGFYVVLKEVTEKSISAHLIDDLKLGWCSNLISAK